MQPNVSYHFNETRKVQVKVLDESLAGLGLEPGALVELRHGDPDPDGTEVWEFDGTLQARRLEHCPEGSVTAYTPFLSSRICYFIPSIHAEQINVVGWISGADVPKDSIGSASKTS